MAMAAAEEVQFSLKVMVMKESNKVIYAEVDSDFADALFSFLTLPLGTVMELLVKNRVNNTLTVGSLITLLVGLMNLDSGHFWTEAGKQMLVFPRNSSEIECRRLKLKIYETPPIQYFMCGNQTCISMYRDMKCPCSTSTNTMTRYAVEIVAQSGGKSVFTVHGASFLLTDDLCITPNTSASLLRILKLNGIEDSSVLEERTLTFGSKEIGQQGSLVSQTPITDIFLSNSSSAPACNERKKFPGSAKYEPNAFSHTQNSENISSDSKKITVKVLVQKSTDRILLAQSRSISKLKVGEYMKSRETNTRLLEPQIPPYYLSSHQIFPLSQQNPPVICKRSENGWVKLFVPTTSALGHAKMKMIEPRGQDSFVKGPATFMVTDGLVVSTPSSNYIISTLSQMKIPLSDVDEQELDIGIEEALSILKASLTSTCALTEGLKPFLKIPPKQEK